MHLLIIRVYDQNICIFICMYTFQSLYTNTFYIFYTKIYKMTNYKPKMANCITNKMARKWDGCYKLQIR